MISYVISCANDSILVTSYWNTAGFGWDDLSRLGPRSSGLMNFARLRMMKQMTKKMPTIRTRPGPGINRDLCSPSPPYLLRHGIDNWTAASRFWCTPAPFQLQDTWSFSPHSKGSTIEVHPFRLLPSLFTFLLPGDSPPFRSTLPRPSSLFPFLYRSPKQLRAKKRSVGQSIIVVHSLISYFSPVPLSLWYVIYRFLCFLLLLPSYLPLSFSCSLARSAISVHPSLVLNFHLPLLHHT